MGLKSVAILLGVFICLWLIRRWTTHQQIKKAQASTAESAERPARRNRQKITPVLTVPAAFADTELPAHVPGHGPNYMEQPGTSNRIAINFNEIEIDNAHSSRPDSPSLPVQVADTPAINLGTAQRESPAATMRETGGPQSGNTTAALSLAGKISYLEKQVHENNRDITMLSEKLASAIDAKRASERQHEQRLRVEQDRVLFHEARLQSELEKLKQIESRLRQRGMTLEQLLVQSGQAEELEQQVVGNRQEIARLSELLALAKGYQTGSNKRNEELRALLWQADRIAELEAQVALCQPHPRDTRRAAVPNPTARRDKPPSSRCSYLC